MKSSIFDGDPLGPRRARKPVTSRHNLKPLFNRKAQLASPYPHSSSVFSPKPSPILETTTFKSHKSTTPNRSLASLPATLSTVSWNLDEMLTKYHEKGLLPTPLSPSLPDTLNDINSTSNSNSNTKHSKQHIDKDSDPSKSQDLKIKSLKAASDGSTYNQFASPKYSPESSGAQDSDVDNISLLMLLPTLPLMFDKHITSERHGDIVYERSRDKNQEKVEKVEKVDKFEKSNIYNGKPDKYEKVSTSKAKSSITDTPSTPVSVSSSYKVKKLTSHPSKFIVRISYSPNSYKRQHQQHQQQQQQQQQASARPIAGLGLSINPEAGLLISSKDHPVSEEQQKLLSRKNYWLQSARETRQKSKDLESIPDKRLMSVVVRFDSILLFVILYDFEQKYRHQSKKMPTENSWLLVIDDCRELIKSISAILDMGPYMSNLTGVLRFMIAMAYKRINSIIDELVNHYKEKLNELNGLNGLNGITSVNPRSFEIATKIMEYQETQIKNYKRMQHEFENAQVKIVMFGKYFPKTWGMKNLEPMSRTRKGGGGGGGGLNNLVPASDNFYLPIGIYSDLQEVSGFMYSCVRELLEVVLQDQLKKCIYLMKSGLNNSKK